jgi:cellulose synthase/poly-beta-1,6-N-acetylglucosamine synthase-like glycosyltransferase
LKIDLFSRNFQATILLPCNISCSSEHLLANGRNNTARAYTLLSRVYITSVSVLPFWSSCIFWALAVKHYKMFLINFVMSLVRLSLFTCNNSRNAEQILHKIWFILLNFVRKLGFSLKSDSGCFAGKSTFLSACSLSIIRS